MTGRIAGTPVEVYLDALASDAPTPGGGAVAALAGATGAALISMVCNLTIGRTGYEEAEERMRGVLDAAEASRTALLDLADRDAAAFGAVMAAFTMPKETDAERAVRSQAIQEGYSAAAEVPLDIARRAAELMELAREVTEIGNANAASDGASAAQVLSASVWSATYNVEINAAALKDPREGANAPGRGLGPPGTRRSAARRHQRRLRRSSRLSRCGASSPASPSRSARRSSGRIWRARPTTMVRDADQVWMFYIPDRHPLVRPASDRSTWIGSEGPGGRLAADRERRGTRHTSSRSPGPARDMQCCTSGTVTGRPRHWYVNVEAPLRTFRPSASTPSTTISTS